MVARALERVGDRWSLLVIRDLLTGDKRFTDLMDRLGGITPKTLHPAAARVRGGRDRRRRPGAGQAGGLVPPHVGRPGPRAGDRRAQLVGAAARLAAARARRAAARRAPAPLRHPGH
ncbi:MAG TPA: helix-turn-helix domain-containing protein, partial [Streptosporangiaceae bacterium]